MGLVNLGVPHHNVDYMQSAFGLDVFVEGGTYRGHTAKSMSETFKNVYTIEKSEKMYESSKTYLSDIPNITLLKGDTREHLPAILDENDNILFWLDAHWSGGNTYGEEDECPLLEELKIIFTREKNYIILIDDARLFLAPPPKPHDFANWPSLTDISKAIPQNWELIEFEDVLYLFPENRAKQVKTFFQDATNKNWEKYLKRNKSPLYKFLTRLGL